MHETKPIFVHITGGSTLIVYFLDRGMYFQMKWDEQKIVPSAIKENFSQVFTDIYSTKNLEIGTVMCLV